MWLSSLKLLFALLSLSVHLSLSLPQGCSCNGNISDRGGGECKTEHEGEPFCYVNSGQCPDQQESSQSGWFWSKQACVSASTCSCNGNISQKGSGECKTEHKGQLFCYVNQGQCPDEKESSQSGWFWSTQACVQGTRPSLPEPKQRSGASTCSCNGNISEKGSGECRTTHNGQTFCYVNQGQCPDEAESSQSGWFWSNQACAQGTGSTPDEPDLHFPGNGSTLQETDLQFRRRLNIEASTCSCNGNISDRGSGECETTHEEKPFCYVNQGQCPDEQESSQSGWFWSKQACASGTGPSLTRSSGGTCPSGWTLLTTGCYRIFPETGDAKNFEQATAFCQSQGGYLAQIDSQSKQDALGQFWKRYPNRLNHVWIGATDRTKEGEWRWIHSGQKMTFTAWYSGEPNNSGNEDCASAGVYPGGLFAWNDISCTRSYAGGKALCEYSTSGTTPQDECPVVIGELGDGIQLDESTVEPSTGSKFASTPAECCSICQGGSKATSLYMFRVQSKRCYCRKLKPGVTPKTEPSQPNNPHFTDHCCKGNDGVATLSSQHDSMLFGPSNCLDGNADTFCHSTNYGGIYENNPYFMMEYPTPVSVTEVKVQARNDVNADRVKNVVVTITNTKPTKGTIVSGPQLGSKFVGPASAGQWISFTSGSGIEGKYAVVQQQYKGILNFAEVEVKLDGQSSLKYLTSPNYPNNYPNNKHTTQTMSVPAGSPMIVKVLDFQIEDHSRCRWDYVQICDSNGKCQKKMCGTKNVGKEPLEFHIDTSTATVLFHSDGSVTQKGFKFSYEASPNDQLQIGRCECGVKGRTNRIVGGQEADKNEYPWQVVLNPGGYFCGGVLLTSKHILTSAHCTEDLDASSVNSITAVVGEHDITNSFDGQERISVSNKNDHPNFNPETLNYDLSILTLSRAVKFRTAVKPICLPNPSRNYDGITATVTGWGTLFDEADEYPSKLQEVNVQTMTNSKCAGPSTVYTSSDITDAMICAASPNKDSCKGDSGGPLIAPENGGQYYSLIGVVSWGDGCAKLRAPGVYARVTPQVVDWIQHNIAGGLTCDPPKPF